MLRVIWVAIISALCVMPTIAADKGLGLVVGHPTGLHYKQWKQGRNKAIQAGLGWETGKASSLAISADVIVHNYQHTSVKKGNLPIYYGAGLQLDLGAEMSLGVRFPVGLNYQFDKLPFDAFFELVPGMLFIPASEFTLTPSLGARYYFD